ncbi:MAG: peptidase S41 [Anaeromyxobacter sp.]|nr:peptidase S41 [Anaeromyxobacter sp.]MBL0278173.1 peptidase S41 [Anaeromyxobacter sp.]
MFAPSRPAPSPRLAVLALVPALALALSGCSRKADCSDATTKASVLATARDWYLFDDLIPAAGLDPADPTQSPQDFLDQLTAEARAQGKDRGFSYLTTRAESSQFFVEGTSQGYGLGLRQVGGTRLLLTQVFGGSPAALAGFARGDELLAISPTLGGLDLLENQVATLLPAGLLGQALSSGVAGTTRSFRVRRADGALAVRTATTATYSLDPVPDAAAPLILDRGAAGKVGYLMLRTFVGTADPLLRQAAAAFRAAGVTELVIDLRYNGGGRIDVAETFLDLLRAAPGSADVMFRFRYNARHAAAEESAFFRPLPQSLPLTRVAFIVTGGSASASELLVNSLQPYLPVALIGERTYGKPVGQFGFEEPDCPTLLYLISFQLLNRDGAGDYFQGLPDAAFTGASCAAEDDLGHPTGDAAEASTAAALQWLADGTCPAGPIPDPAPAAASRLLEGRGPAGFPEVAAPSLVQRHLPGVF